MEEKETENRPLSPKGLNISISKLIHAGISIRQLSRLTGISKKVIENALE